jgi:2-dehydropantoate 2-reductase
MQVSESAPWQIIGSGAIGCLWAANLIKSNQQVHLISRHKDLPQTLHYQNLQGEKSTFKCSQAPLLELSDTPILVCVKAPQVLKALLDQQVTINKNQVIILMHNGMGTAEQVLKHFPDNPIICATTANACLLNSPFNITQTGLGITYLGAFNEQAKAYSYLLNTFNNALENCHWNEDVKKTLWLKLLINIAINPLTAIHQVKNGALAEHHFQTQIAQIIDEALPVLEKLDFVLDIEIDESSNTDNPFSRQNLRNTINTVIHNTAENYSSMNRDIFFQRATENEYINGYLLKKAAQWQIDTPLIHNLYQQILSLEKG